MGEGMELGALCVTSCGGGLSLPATKLETSKKMLPRNVCSGMSRAMEGRDNKGINVAASERKSKQSADETVLRGD
jgi:hypothetical protein